MQRKYIHYGHPEIAGLYYRDGNVYFENLDSNVGKMIIVIFQNMKGEEKGMKEAIHKLWYNTWYFYNRIDGKHDILSYLRWMKAVM